jgi:hypothetical protein
MGQFFVGRGALKHYLVAKALAVVKEFSLTGFNLLRNF